MLLYSTILDINKGLTKENFVNLVIECNQNNKHAVNRIPNLSWDGKTMNIRLGSGTPWLDIQEYRNGNIVAIRYEKIENGVVWDTDFVLNFNEMKLAIRLERSFTETALSEELQFKTPSIVKYLIKRNLVIDDYEIPMSLEPIVISEHNYNIVNSAFQGIRRYHFPIVYVTKTPTDNEPFDCRELCNRLKGVAHVLVEEKTSPATNNFMNRKVPGRAAGTVGIICPGKRPESLGYCNESGYGQIMMDVTTQSVLSYANIQSLPPLL